MANNGNKKDRLIRSVNFGRVGDPSRELVEIYERKFGKNKLSKLVRELIVHHLSSKEEFDGYKINMLKGERIDLLKQMRESSKQIEINGNKILKLGGDVDDV
jgi:hypothetical protein